MSRSVAAGARLVCGGRRSGTDTAFFPATVLTDIPEGSPAWSEELFGPVGCVYRARDVADAIRIANATRFGLGASAWTSDAAEQEAFARGIDSGSVFVNDMVVSDPIFNERIPNGNVVITLGSQPGESLRQQAADNGCVRTGATRAARRY